MLQVNNFVYALVWKTYTVRAEALISIIAPVRLRRHRAIEGKLYLFIKIVTRSRNRNASL